MKEARPREKTADSEFVSIDNRLPVNHPRKHVLERAIREALAGLPGPWDVSIDLIAGVSWSITIVAPDACRWSIACANPEHDVQEFIADRVRTACSRRRWLKKGEATVAKKKKTVPEVKPTGPAPAAPAPPAAGTPPSVRSPEALPGGGQQPAGSSGTSGAPSAVKPSEG